MLLSGISRHHLRRKSRLKIFFNDTIGLEYYILNILKEQRSIYDYCLEAPGQTSQLAIISCACVLMHVIGLWSVDNLFFSFEISFE